MYRVFYEVELIITHKIYLVCLAKVNIKTIGK